MHSVRTRFGGLYWRLTGSYFAVTLLAAVIIEIAITLPASMQGYQQVNSCDPVTGRRRSPVRPHLLAFLPISQHLLGSPAGQMACISSCSPVWLAR